MAPRILVIYTGGTIGMVQDPSTAALVPYDFSHLIDNVPKIGRLNFELTHATLAPPIDSSNMNPTHWADIASTIEKAYDAHDGFVVLHGTDTMAYTASALSFMLGNLRKPVILTGSQLPIGAIREDGTENLITALQIAAARDEYGKPQVQEVAISFGDHLLRGNRAVKVSSTNFGAFESPNYPPLAVMDLHIRYNTKRLWRPSGARPVAPHYRMDSSLAVVTLFPGMTETQLRHQLDAPDARAIVLRTFGAGNAPTESWLLDAVRDTCARGVLVANVTQCLNGGVEAKRYATGDALTEAGVVSAFDMTFEATVTKLMYLFGQDLSLGEATEYFQQSICGELTPPSETL